MSVLQDVGIWPILIKYEVKQKSDQNVANGCQKVFGRLLIYFNLLHFFSGALDVGKYAWDASKFQCHRNEQRKWRFEILRLVHSKVVSITTTWWIHSFECYAVTLLPNHPKFPFSDWRLVTLPTLDWERLTQKKLKSFKTWTCNHSPCEMWTN